MTIYKIIYSDNAGAKRLLADRNSTLAIWKRVLSAD